MSKGNETTTKFKVDISELKSQFQEAQRTIRVANSQFKAATAGMDDWSKSSDGLSAKLNQLNSVLEGEKGKLKSLEKQYELTVQEQGAASKGAQELLIKLNNQKAAVANVEKQIKKYTSQLNELESGASDTRDSLDKLTDEISDEEAELNKLKTAYKNAVLEQGKESAEAKELSAEISALSSEIKSNRDKLADATTAADQFDASIQSLSDDSEKSEGGFTVLKGALANLVAEGIKKASDAIKNFISDSIDVGKSFESSMSEVQAISGATDDELLKLRETAKEFGSSTNFSASQAADALKYMSLAGWTANESIDGLGGILDLAASSGMDLADASDMVTDYLSAFGMQADDSAKFADILAYAQSNANTTAEGLGEAYKNSAANLNASGQDIETTTALLAMMANQGLKGSEAGTALTAVMRDMTAKMKDGKIAIGDTSVEVMDANGNYRDLTEILKDVETATYGMGDAEKATALMGTFTSDSIKGLNLLLNAGVSEAEDFEEELRNSSGSAKAMADVMNNNLNGDLASLSSLIEGLQIQLYEKLQPALRKGIEWAKTNIPIIIDKIKALVGFLNKISPILKGLGVAIAGLALAGFIQNINKIGMAIKTWTAATKVGTAVQWLLNAAMSANPITLIVIGIAALIAAFVALWNKSEAFRNFWIGLWDNIKSAFDAVVGWFKDNWKTLILFLMNPIAGLFKYFYEHFEGFRNFVDGVMKSVKGFFSSAWEGIKSIWLSASNWFNSTVIQPIKAVFEPIVAWFAQLFSSIWQTVVDIWNDIVGFLSGCWELIKIVFEPVAEWFRLKFKTAWDNIKAIFSAVKSWFTARWNEIKSVFAPAAAWFQTVFSNAWNAVKTIFSGVKAYFEARWNDIKTVFGTVGDWFKIKFDDAWKKITNAFSSVNTFFSGVWESVKKPFSTVADWFYNTFSRAWQRVKDVFSTGGSIFVGIQDGISSTFTTVVNGIIRGINNVITVPFNAINTALRKIRDISIAGVEPFKGKINEISIPQIPLLAKGGVVARKTLAMVGENGKEAIVPLERNLGWIRQLANHVAAEIYEKTETIRAKGKSVVNNFYQTNNSPKALSRLEIYRQSKRLLNMKGV